MSYSQFHRIMLLLDGLIPLLCYWMLCFFILIFYEWLSRVLFCHVYMVLANSTWYQTNELQTSCQVIGDVLRIRQVFTNLVRYKYITDIDRKLGVLFLLESQNMDFFNMDTELTSLFPSQVLNATFREFLGLFNISCVLNSTCSHVYLFIWGWRFLNSYETIVNLWDCPVIMFVVLEQQCYQVYK